MAATAIEAHPAEALAPSKPSTRARALIFSAALAVRILASVMFLGSIHRVDSITNSIELLDGHKVYLPYFPAVNAFLWFGGTLSALFRVPLPLSMKLWPIYFSTRSLWSWFTNWSSALSPSLPFRSDCGMRRIPWLS
jgi:hypothetical protein